ncbi:TPA: hypothetical protein ACJE2D_002019, partial [Campylobacter jejuni]
MVGFDRKSSSYRMKKILQDGFFLAIFFFVLLPS